MLLTVEMSSIFCLMAILEMFLYLLNCDYLSFIWSIRPNLFVQQ